MSSVPKTNQFWQATQCVLIGLMLSILGIAGCAEQPKTLIPPIEIPFSLDKGSETAELEVKIPEKHTYTFGLEFMLNKNEPKDAYRLLDLLGHSSSKNPKTGKYDDLGVPLKIRLQVQSLDKNTSFLNFDNTESEIAVYAGGFGSYRKKISYLLLEPGVYKVKVENKQATSVFSDRKINFHVYRAYLGK